MVLVTVLVMVFVLGLGLGLGFRPVALCEDVLADGGELRRGDDVGADRRLDGHLVRRDMGEIWSR